MRFHFIAIGGSIMHSLALALHQMGHRVSGSDDAVYEPARSRLRQAGILPEKEGWYPHQLSDDIDTVILGMHARADNPELDEARKRGLSILSFPEFMARQSSGKRRLVVAGSHGKTTTTSMIMHALDRCGRAFDFMVGSTVTGFDRQVQLSDAPVIVMEGDEYLSSAIDPRPKFLHYRPDVCIITGMAWDHMNVFPTAVVYEKQFDLLMNSMEPGNVLIVNQEDERLMSSVLNSAAHLHVEPYKTPDYEAGAPGWRVIAEGRAFPTRLFGKHNMSNLAAAARACAHLEIAPVQFYATMADFAGPARRMEFVAGNDHSSVYIDFAHAPSKVKATIEAVREQFPDRHLLAVLELHTYSSLNPLFLEQYHGSAEAADRLVVFLNAHAMQQKGLSVTAKDVVGAFDHPNTVVVFSRDEIMSQLPLPLHRTTLLLMSSGNFDGLDMDALANLATT